MTSESPAPALQLDAVSDDESFRAAVQIMARHRLRAGTGRCGQCGSPWAFVSALHRISGCPLRRRAGHSLTSPRWSSVTELAGTARNGLAGGLTPRPPLAAPAGQR